MAICTVQVTNVSPKASYQNIKELFSYFGAVDELKVYPEDEEKKDIPSRVCFVTFKERSSLEAALHLTNTLFIDRSLIVSQSRYEVIPEENTAMSLAPPAVPATLADPLLNPPTGPLLPTPQAPSLLGTPTQPLLQNPIVTAIQQAQSVASSINANIQGSDTAVGSGFISQLNISGNVDPTKIDEIKRTIYVGNLNSGLTADQVMNFFQACGEIKYVRMAGDETQPARFAFVEFTNPESVQIALQYNGAMFGDRPVKVNHSKNAIVKPQGKTPEMAQREVDEAMRKVREATQVISTSIEPGKSSRSRTRSRSHGRRRSPRDRNSRRRHSRSPSYDRYRRRSRSPRRYRSPRRRSPSPRRRDYRGRSWRERRSYSRSPDRGYRSRRRSSPDRRRGRSRSISKSPSPARHRRRRSKDRSRERRKRRSPSRSPSPIRKKSKKSKKEKRKRRSPTLSPSPAPADESHGEDQFSDGGRDDDKGSYAGSSYSHESSVDDRSSPASD